MTGICKVSYKHEGTPHTSSFEVENQAKCNDQKGHLESTGYQEVQSTYTESPTTPTAAANTPSTPAPAKSPKRPQAAARPATGNISGAVVGRSIRHLAQYSKQYEFKIKVSDNLSYEKGARALVKGKNINGELKAAFSPDFSPADLESVLKNVNSALTGKSDVYDLAQVKALLKGKELTFTQLKQLKGLKGDALVKKLIELLGYDASQFEPKGNGKALVELKDLIAKKDVTLKQIQANTAYIALTANGAGKLTDANQKIMDAVRAKVSELTTKENAAKAAADKAADDKVKDAITNARTPQALVALYRDNRAVIDRSPERSVQIRNQALAIVKSGEYEVSDVEPIMDLVKQAPALQKDERIITYNNTNEGRTFATVVIKKDGKWQINSIVDPDRKYYLEERDGKPVMRSSIGFPDPSFETKVIETGPVAPTTPNGAVAFETNEGEDDVKIIYRDKDGDGKLNIENEKDGTELYVRSNGNWVKIEDASQNHQFMLLLANRGNAEATTERTVDRSKIADVRAIIRAYAKTLGMSFADAAKAYARSRAFRNVSFVELENGHRELTVSLASILSSSDPKAFLEAKGYDPVIARLTAGFINSQKPKTEAEIAAFMLRCTMARLTDMPELFGIDKAALNGTKTYAPKTVNKQNMIDWLKGLEITDSGDSTDGTTDVKNLQLSSKLVSQLEKVKTPEEALKYYKSSEYNSQVRNDAAVLKAMAKIYIDAEKYEEAKKFIETLGPATKKEFYKHFAQQMTTKVQEYSSGATKDLKAAEATLKRLSKLIEDMKEDGKPLKNSLYQAAYALAIAYAEDPQQSTPAMQIIKDHIPPEAEIVLEQTKGDKKTTTKLTGLEALLNVAAAAKNETFIQEVINNKDKKYTDLQRAYAYQAKAKLYLSWGIGGRNGKHLVENYRTAFDACYEAFKLASKIKGADDTKASAVTDEAVGMLKEIKDKLFGPYNSHLETSKTYKGWQKVKKQMDKKFKEVVTSNADSSKKVAGNNGGGKGPVAKAKCKDGDTTPSGNKICKDGQMVKKTA